MRAGVLYNPIIGLMRGVGVLLKCQGEPRLPVVAWLLTVGFLPDLCM